MLQTNKPWRVQAATSNVATEAHVKLTIRSLRRRRIRVSGKAVLPHRQEDVEI